MPTTFEKLNWKPGIAVVVLDSPASSAVELQSIPRVTCALEEQDSVPFLLAFVTAVAQVEALAPRLERVLAPDAVLWFAYPKLTSRRYKSDITRDRGWQALRALGFDTVRAVAIDEDWSALRFRREEFIGKTVRKATV